jgi:hypothetical protein
VQDANGAAVPAATVKVINSANNAERTAVTDENGFYTVTNLPAGTVHDRGGVEGLQESPRLRQERHLLTRD